MLAKCVVVGTNKIWNLWLIVRFSFLFTSVRSSLTKVQTFPCHFFTKNSRNFFPAIQLPQSFQTSGKPPPTLSSHFWRWPPPLSSWTPADHVLQQHGWERAWHSSRCCSLLTYRVIPEKSTKLRVSFSHHLLPYSLKVNFIPSRLLAYLNVQLCWQLLFSCVAKCSMCCVNTEQSLCVLFEHIYWMFCVVIHGNTVLVVPATEVELMLSCILVKFVCCYRVVINVIIDKLWSQLMQPTVCVRCCVRCCVEHVAFWPDKFRLTGLKLETSAFSRDPLRHGEVPHGDFLPPEGVARERVGRDVSDEAASAAERNETPTTAKRQAHRCPPHEQKVEAVVMLMRSMISRQLCLP